MNLRRASGHPNVIQLIDVLENDRAVFCFLELAENGEVNEYIGMFSPWFLQF